MIKIYWQCPKCECPNADAVDPVDGPFNTVTCDDCGAAFDQDAVQGLNKVDDTP